MSDDDHKYRRGVGVMLLNKDGKVFVGRRIDNTDEAWQMPQGGIDEGEKPYPAALRELYEETSIKSVEKLGEIRNWLTYDIPRDIVGQAWKGRYRGQTQKWFALRFTGDDSEIDISTPAGGAHKPEFARWRWARIAELPQLIVPFKRPVYERIAKEFAQWRWAKIDELPDLIVPFKRGIYERIVAEFARFARP